MNLNRLSGVLVHPTSFPGPYGIGDLGKNAYKFIDFLESANQRLWQVLPLGPTSFGDSPYQSFSTFAGNQLLISPEILVEEGYITKEDLNDIPDFDPMSIDYGEVINYKNSIFKKAFDSFSKLTSKKKSLYEKFCTENKEWLDDYALFVSIKDYFIKERQKNPDSKEYKDFVKEYSKLFSENMINDYYYGAVWSTWPAELVSRTKSEISKYTNLLEDNINLIKFLQYEFFRQWYALKDYANKKEIKIIGDIPIFVAYDSCDVWANKELFHLDSKGFPKVVAGVPPDYFSETGQLWGNPLYDWEKNKELKYKWWISRIKNAITSMDVIRVDHFRAFDSYWEIPFGEKTAVKGNWIKGPGKDLFVEVEKALGKLPIIAEDLGDLTPSVYELREELNFPGMKILQFAFEGLNENVYLPHNFETPNTYVYTGTHDNDTSRGWYNSVDEVSKDYFRKYMNVSGEDVSWDFIRLALSTTAENAIIPIQDIMNLGAEHRMNTPGVASGNWKFRYTSDMLKEEYASGLSYFSKLYNRNDCKFL